MRDPLILSALVGLNVFGWVAYLLLPTMSDKWRSFGELFIPACCAALNVLAAIALAADCVLGLMQ